MKTSKRPWWQNRQSTVFLGVVNGLAFLTPCDQALKSVNIWLAKSVFFTIIFRKLDKKFLLVNNCLTLASFTLVKNLD